MIFATVGTTHLPFDRFVRYINNLPVKLRNEIFLQAGNSVLQPLVSYKRFLSHKEFTNYIIHADLIISHGGFGILAECIKYKKKVIVIPRLHKYEAVNPQDELATYLSKKEKMIFKFEAEMDLSETIYYMLKIEDTYKNEYKSKIPSLVEDYLNSLL